MTVKLNTIYDLCNYINVSVSFLKYILYVKKDNYHEFNIPKGNGNQRTITAPKEELKFIQRQLLLFLEKNYDFLECQHGFIKGRSCVTNAQNHVGKRFVLTCDIENFFDNIHFGRVRGLFLNKPFNYSNEVATTIAKIVCYKNKLPQGAPTSPIISNMICYTMDRELNFVAKKYNCKYSRYADDITFSTDSEFFPKEIAIIKDNDITLSERIIKTINGGFSNGFCLNHNKTKLNKRIVRQEVTGIIVNRKTNVNKKYISNLRAILHTIKINGCCHAYEKTFNTVCPNKEVARLTLFNYLAGKINYLKMVKSDTDGLYLKYANEFNQVFKCDTFDITEEMKIRKYASKKCFVIECGAGNGSAFSIDKNIIITSTHVILDKSTCPFLVTNEEPIKYQEQFPIASSKIDFVYLLHPELRNKKLISDFTIQQINYENDIIELPISINNQKRLKLAKRKVKIGEEVYMIGYPAFNGFKQTDLHIIKTKVIGENTLFNIPLINTEFSPKHGMSGGPVLNKNKEVVGIVYAGYDDQDNHENIGFISLI